MPLEGEEKKEAGVMVKAAPEQLDRRPAEEMYVFLLWNRKRGEWEVVSLMSWRATDTEELACARRIQAGLPPYLNRMPYLRAFLSDGEAKEARAQVKAVYDVKDDGDLVLAMLSA